MDNIYLLMIVALAVLAIADLVVGVSNDAVNFLNSAIGSKAISFKTIMIVASIGIAVGAVFSSGMMEVARLLIFYYSTSLIRLVCQPQLQFRLFLNYLEQLWLWH